MAKKKAAPAPEPTTEMALAEARRALNAAFPDRADEIMRALERAAMPTLSMSEPFRVIGKPGSWLMKRIEQTAESIDDRYHTALGPQSVHLAEEWTMTIEAIRSGD